jgi:hypothetical protein
MKFNFHRPPLDQRPRETWMFGICNAVRYGPCGAGLDGPILGGPTDCAQSVCGEGKGKESESLGERLGSVDWSLKSRPGRLFRLAKQLSWSCWACRILQQTPQSCGVFMGRLNHPAVVCTELSGLSRENHALITMMNMPQGALTCPAHSAP